MKLILIACALMSLDAASLLGQQTDTQPKNVKTAGEAFKNIQVLKRVPEDQWFDTMAFIAASLGVTCEHCHKSSFEVDEGSPAKLKARQMMRMVDEINRDTYDAKVVITCNTCHRGSLKPQAAPVPDAEHWQKAAEKAESLPSPAELLARYRRAEGLDSIKHGITQSVTFQVETYDGSGPARTGSVEVLIGGPGRTRMTERQNDNVKTFIRNDREAWVNEGKGWREMSEGEAFTSFEAANLLDPDQVGQVEASGPAFVDRVRGQRAHVVPVQSKGERKWLFFDAETGFLLRQRIFFGSFYGDGSVDIDYADYQKAGSLELPSTFYVVNAGGSGLTIRKAVSRKTNIRIDESQFRRNAA